MIGSLRGSLLDRFTAGEALIEVNGVGYRVQVTPSTATSLGGVGDEVFVYTHHSVREDSETLFGFPSLDERAAFEALISAHGVGPSLGMAILSVHEPAALQRAVAEEDVAALCLVPGVGKKTAARLLVELQSKLDLPDIDLSDTTVTSANGGTAKSDVREALEGLGYRADEIALALNGVDESNDTSTLLKNALKVLAG